MTGGWQKVLIGLVIAFVAGLVLLGFLAGVAVYGFKSAQRAGNETATIQNMQTIATVEAQYFISHNRTFGSFAELMKEEMLSSKFAGSPPLADGYTFDLRVDRGSFTLNADPIDDTYGKRHFYLDSTSGAIRVNPDHQAGPSDPLVADR